MERRSKGKPDRTEDVGASRVGRALLRGLLQKETVVVKEEEGREVCFGRIPARPC